MEAKPGYADVMQFVDTLKGNRLVKTAVAGKSFEGREIPVLEITDPRVADDDKQLVIVAGGTHGSEEAGRVATMAFVEWLASGAPYVTLRNQKFIVFPCVNPDGSIRNSYHNAQDINIYMSYAPGAEPTSHEGKVVWSVVGGLNPALVVDVHGLAGGAMAESFYCHVGFHNSPVTKYLNLVLAEECRQAAERAGFPQREPHQEDLPGLPQRFTKECNAFGYTLEITENFYPLHLMRESGLVRLQALAAIGDRRNWYHYYQGYPCEAIAGNAMCLLTAHGRTAAQRGQNRRQLIATVKDVPNMHRAAADKDNTAAAILEVARDLEGLPRYSMQMRVHKPARIREVKYDGKELAPGDETSGYIIWEDNASWLIRVNIDQMPTKGTHTAAARYDVEW